MVSQFYAEKLLRPAARKEVPKTPRFGNGTMPLFGGTCSYGGGTWVGMAIPGDKPSPVVVRCSSVAVGVSIRRRQLAAGGDHGGDWW